MPGEGNQDLNASLIQTDMGKAERPSEQKGFKYTNLFLAIILASLATPIVKWLMMHGGKLGISNPDAISFCNLLFVGNLCSGLVVLITVGWADIWRHLTGISQKTGMLLVGNLLLGTVLAPILLYVALETTMVTNLVLLTRIEAVAYPIIGVLFFKDPISKMNWIGLAFITLGTIALVLLQGGGKPTAGDGLGVLAGVLYAIGSGLGRTVLENTSLSAFIFIRNLAGAIIFFLLAIILYGFDHFTEAFSVDLWVVMTVYAALVVVLGQITWFRSVATFSSGTVSAWSTLTPVLGILFAYLLLREVPDMSQWLAAAIILSGMAISQIQTRQTMSPPRIVERGLAGA